LGWPNKRLLKTAAAISACLDITARSAATAAELYRFRHSAVPLNYFRRRGNIIARRRDSVRMQVHFVLDDLFVGAHLTFSSAPVAREFSKCQIKLKLEQIKGQENRIKVRKSSARADQDFCPSCGR
jgi:hypothetical protein